MHHSLLHRWRPRSAAGLRQHPEGGVGLADPEPRNVQRGVILDQGITLPEPQSPIFQSRPGDVINSIVLQREITHATVAVADAIPAAGHIDLSVADDEDLSCASSAVADDEAIAWSC